MDCQVGASLGELEMIFNWRMITDKGRSGFSIVYESSRCSPAEECRACGRPSWALVGNRVSKGVTMLQYHARPCNTTQYHAIPHNATQYQSIPINTMQYHAIPHNTTQCPGNKFSKGVTKLQQARNRFCRPQRFFEMVSDFSWIIDLFQNVATHD